MDSNHGPSAYETPALNRLSYVGEGGAVLGRLRGLSIAPKPPRRAHRSWHAQAALRSGALERSGSATTLAVGSLVRAASTAR